MAWGPQNRGAALAAIQDRARSRELAVLLATREGRAAWSIAADLGVSRRTVERHRARLRFEGKL